MELIEDVPPEFFREFYLTLCDFYQIDPDALYIRLMEGNL